MREERVPGAHAHGVAPAVVLWSLDRTGPRRRAIATLDEGQGRRVARVDASAPVHLTFEPVDREVLGCELPEAQLDLDRLETLAGVRMNATGIVRYLRKRAEREADAVGRDAPDPQAS